MRSLHTRDHSGSSSRRRYDVPSLARREERDVGAALALHLELRLEASRGSVVMIASDARRRLRIADRGNPRRARRRARAARWRNP
jgi:hypothetical protein